jgi:SAM-dependent methyltransferase
MRGENPRMTINTWDEIAARRRSATAIDSVRYAGDVASDDDFRLIGDVRGKRVLDLGCGAGENAVVLAQQGAHVIAVDSSSGQLALGKRLAEEAEVRVEWHRSDAADLAFLRADSIDVALATGLLGEIEDVDRLFRQVQRVLRPSAPFVFSYEHPTGITIGRDDAPGALPLSTLEVRRSYFDPQPVVVTRAGTPIRLWPRTIADVFSALHRAGYRVDTLLEPEPTASADPGPPIPSTIIWRARKEGV